MSAKYIAVGTLVLFISGVVWLSVSGHKFLNQMTVCDTTVSYLDLARQATDKRDYATADEYYKQALMYARQNDPTGQTESAMLLTYAKFAIDKKHDRQLAVQLQARAQELRRAHALAIAQQKSAPANR